MRVRSSGRTTQWGAGEPGATHGWNTTWPFRSLASNWARRFQLGQGHGVLVVVGFHDFHAVFFL